MRTNGKGMLLLAVLLCLWASWSCSRKPLGGKTYTVGVVNLNEDLDKVFHGFKAYLANLGYREGENIAYLYSGAQTHVADLEKDLRLFVEKRVDLVVAITTPAAGKAKQLTAGTDIPVVFAPVFDPVGAGIVPSLLKPDANITGIKVGGNCGKALEWLLKVAPAANNILVPFNRDNMATVQSLQELQAAAAKLNVQLSVREVADRQELLAVLGDIPAEVNGLWLLNSHFLVSNTSLFVDAAIAGRLPLGSSTSQVDDGILVTYGQHAARTGEMAAALADKIFQGISPADLPVEITDYFLGINLKTANAIGIDISDDILHVADTIIRP